MRVTQKPDRERSPKGTFIVHNSRPLNPDAREHTLSLALHRHPTRFSCLYRYPRYANLYFAPDEQHLVIEDQSGSNLTECKLLRRITAPPYFVEDVRAEIGSACWSLFWEQHHKRWRDIQAEHCYTYLCEWLDTSRFVVGLRGDGHFDKQRTWSVSNWHCIYDIKRHRAYLDKGSIAILSGSISISLGSNAK